MKHLTAIFCLTLVILLGSVGKSFALPQCKGSPFVFTTINDISAWDGCEGTVTFGPSSKFSGDKYVGEFRNSIPNGQGTYTYGPSSKWAGDKYVGEYRDNKRNGQGTYTRANGQITEGIWKDDKFQYAQKGAPPVVTARKSPPPSSSASEIENEKLRRENARLRKQNQSIPKRDVALAKRNQEALQVLGLYSGKLDGVIGVRTRLAIRGWQKRNGYSESGEITETQIVKLEQDATQHLAKQQSNPKQVANRPKSKPKSGSTGSGFSADYEKGVDASLRGNFKTAMKKWKPLAERGDATSQFQVGWLYFEGKGVTQNYSTAVKWYRLAAEQGFAYAQSALGLMYSNGTGISQDYTRTYMWFSIAASLWDTNAGAMRDAVAKKMSSTQLETARILIRECVQKNFKGC
jgi:hypothetical protein